MLLHLHLIFSFASSTIPEQHPSLAHLDLFGVQVFGAPEHEALGNPFTAELMNLNHASKRDEAHQCVGREQAEGHLQGLPEGLEVLSFQTRVHHIQKDERGGRAAL